jgi:uncharacterized delta-60 repeat protein
MNITPYSKIRRFERRLFGVFLECVLATCLQAQTPDEFNPGANQTVSAAALEPDGKLVVIGNFTTLGGQTRRYIGRFDADGTLDPGFNPAPDMNVWCLALQADGKMLVGGEFRMLNDEKCVALGRLNPDGTLDGSFRPLAAGAVGSMVVQPDGRILVGGTFQTINGTAPSYLARFSTDGTVDSGFYPDVDGPVNLLALQTDGRILVGGQFSHLDGEVRNSFGRLNADGTLDANFVGNLDSEAMPICLAVQPDGKIVLGGDFSSLDGQARTNLGRLNVDGTLDLDFTPPAFGGQVYALALQSDGKLVVGGSFETVAGQACLRLVRLNSDGTQDGTFATAVDGSVGALLIHPDGRLLVGGWFSSLGGQPRSCIGRLLNTEPADDSLQISGSKLTWSRSGASPEFWQVTIDMTTDGTNWSNLGAAQPIAGGWQFAGISAAPRATIRARGFVAGSCNNAANWFVEEGTGPASISLEPASRTNIEGTTAVFSVAAVGTPPFTYQWYKDGAILNDGHSISGALTPTLTLTNVEALDGGHYSVIIGNSGRVLSSVAAGLTVLPLVTNDWFSPDAGEAGGALALQPDGKVLAEANFTLADQTPVHFARLNLDGTVDATFNPGTSGHMNCFAVEPDGRILVGGGFPDLAGTNCNHIGLLNPDGTLFSNLGSGTDGNTVYCMLDEPGGKILVGGDFSHFNGKECDRLLRLNSDGTLDTSFNAAIGGYGVYCVAERPDGKILVGGDFSTADGQAQANLCRLNPDGSLDGSFNPQFNGYVNCLTVQPNGDILVIGGFSQIGGVVRMGAARFSSTGVLEAEFAPALAGNADSLALQADGKILLGGDFSFLDAQPLAGICRLNADGSRDHTLQIGANGVVTGLALEPDGNMVVAGGFNRLGTLSYHNIGRLTKMGAASQSLSFDGSTVTWLRGGASPEVWRTTFDASTNGTDWVPLGAGMRYPGGWQLSGLNLPATARIRARGFTSSGIRNGSSWFCESVYGPLLIAAQPRSRTNNPGTQAAFSVEASGTPPLSFQWLKNGAMLRDATSVFGAQAPTLMLGDVFGADSGAYSVVISNTSEVVTSLVATLTVNDPLITNQPASLALNAGEDAVFQVAAVGSSPIAYQWWKEATRLEDSTNVSGAHGPTLTLTNALGPDSGSYWVTISNAFGAITSTVATLSVADPFIPIQPADQTAKPGDTVMFSVTAGGSRPLTYQWRKNGVNLLSATNSSLALTNVQWTDGGGYDVVIGNPVGRTNSRRAVLAFPPVPDGFNPGANRNVYALALEPGGSILAGGSFTTLAGQSRSRLGRLRADGTLDSAFDPGPNGTVDALAVQPDGRILAGGDFTTVAGAPRNHLARLNSNGTLDTGFNAVADYTVYALSLQPDGKILVGGAFTNFCGETCGGLGRLNSDGTPDSGFNPGITGTVYTLAIQPDGKILVGGGFSQLGGQPVACLGRLNADGQLDSTFNPAPDGWVYSLTVEPDGKILVGGDFRRIGGETHSYPARLNPDGTLDQSFHCAADGPVDCLGLQADGRVIAGGRFGGLSGQTRWNIGRLDAEGAADSTFNPGVDCEVYALAIQADGNIVLGGGCGTIGGQPRSQIGRLSNTYPAIESLESNETNIVWRRGGSAAEVSEVRMAASTNGTDWLDLGACSRIAGGWQSGEVSLPPQTTVRVRGFMASGEHDGSSSLVEASAGPPAISIQPASVTNFAGSLASFTVLAAGTPPLSYQWYRDGVSLSNAGRVSGAESPTLVLTNMLGGDAATYWVVITNALGRIISAQATLTAVDPVIVAQPSSQAVPAGAYVSLSAKAAGTSPLAYHWWKDGTPLSDGARMSGALTPALLVRGALGSDAGRYSLVVTNTFGSVTSLVAALDVADPFISTQPTNQDINPGQDARFAVAAQGTLPLNYQWRKNGIDIPGATKSLITVTNARQTDIAGYDVLVSNVFGSITSSLANLSVNLVTLDSLDVDVAGTAVRCLALQPDGKILLGGDFYALNGQPRTNLARLNPDGTLDAGFTTGVDGEVMALLVQPDHQIVIGGRFSTVGGQPRARICRLEPDGTVDASFNPGADGAVFCLALQAEGSILVGGDFLSTLAGQPCGGLGRLNADGTPDTSFRTGPSTWCLGVLPDDRILAGGFPMTLGGQPRLLLPDGTAEAGFSNGPNSYMLCLAVQPDGEILVAGDFHTFSNEADNRVRRLNPDGTLDPTFDVAANGQVDSLAIQADGKILAGGWFTTIAGDSRARICRFNPDGTLDGSFNPGANSAYSAVYALAIQPNGKILVGGTFTSLGGQPRSLLGRFSNTEPAHETLSFDGHTITWQLDGSAPEFSRTTFEASTNGDTWFSLGSGTPQAGGWQLAGVSLPLGATIRARGSVQGASDASGWFVESTLVLSQLPPVILPGSGFGVSSSGFGFQYSASPGQTVVIEASTNLLEWESLTTNSVPAAAPLRYFEDPGASNFPSRFYRARGY